MPPSARLLAALGRLGAPQPLQVLHPMINLRHLRTSQAVACQCVAVAAARVFQDDLPAAAPSASSKEAPALSHRTALLAKVRGVSHEHPQLTGRLPVDLAGAPVVLHWVGL